MTGFDVVRKTIGPDSNGTIGHNLYVENLHVGGYTGPIDLENRVEKRAAYLSKALSCHEELASKLFEAYTALEHDFRERQQSNATLRNNVLLDEIQSTLAKVRT